MEFDKKIYDFNWRKLTRWLLPLRLRNAKLIALAEACNSSVIAIYARFINFKKDAAYRLTITPQVCYLQRLLNDRYDYTQRRIRIKDITINKALLLSLAIENKPLLLSLQSEATPQLLPLKFEVAQFGADFIIEVPVDVVFDQQEMRALVNLYKLPTKQFIIKIT